MREASKYEFTFRYTGQHSGYLSYKKIFLKNGRLYRHMHVPGRTLREGLFKLRRAYKNMHNQKDIAYGAWLICPKFLWQKQRAGGIWEDYMCLDLKELAGDTELGFYLDNPEVQTLQQAQELVCQRTRSAELLEELPNLKDVTLDMKSLEYLETLAQACQDGDDGIRAEEFPHGDVD